MNRRPIDLTWDRFARVMILDVSGRIAAYSGLYFRGYYAITLGDDLIRSCDAIVIDLIRAPDNLST